MRITSLILLCTTMLSLGASCTSAPASEERDTLVTGMRLSLSTIAQSGAEYRLTRGTFTILGSDDDGAPFAKAITVDPKDTARSLEVPVRPGNHRVKLEDGWELSVRSGDAFLPVEATLRGDNPIDAYVYENEETFVSFPFALGQTELTLGITVEENWGDPPIQIPAGYDGVIVERLDGSFYIATAGGSECCWETVEETREAFPHWNLYYPGN